MIEYPLTSDSVLIIEDTVVLEIVSRCMLYHLTKATLEEKLKKYGVASGTVFVIITGCLCSNGVTYSHLHPACVLERMFAIAALGHLGHLSCPPDAIRCFFS